MAQEAGIVVTAYSSFGPQSFLELPPAFSMRANDIPLLFDAEPVKTLSAKYNVTPTQILLQWATQRNIAVIPKPNNPSRLAQNLDVLDFNLEGSEIESISNLDKGLRFNDPGFYLPNYPLRIFG